MSDDLVGWQGARPPRRGTLAGARVRLESLSAESHADELVAASRDAPGLWRYLPYGPFPDSDSYRDWIVEHAGGEDPLFFAVIELGSGRAAGVVSYLRAEPAQGVIEIGHIWFAPSLQRTAEATEAIFLLLRHAFDELGNRRVEWKCNAANEKSRAAAERFGLTYEGTFRQHMVVKARNRDSAWYSLLDREWPRARRAYEQWLDETNFTPDGRQIQRLQTIRAEVPGA